MTESAEVVIVGAGVAGATLAFVLARRGTSVLLLERSTVHTDHVRGESITPWGVAEALELGILDVLIGAGGHFASHLVLYNEEVPPETARAGAIDLSKLVPDVAGTLKISHPRMCQALDNTAVAAGARLLRGVGNVQVLPGSPPSVSFIHDGRRRELRPRLVVGADGRGSSVARDIGADLQSDPVHHIFGGLLVEDVDAWPTHEYAVGTEGNGTFYIFPQGKGRLRLYRSYDVAERRRFAGSDGPRNFLDAFRLASVPEGEMIANGRAAGPCIGYANADTWIDRPMAPGVVLIGDAAGYNDPTIGQGLSLAFRDVRLVSQALADNAAWSADIFLPYAEERARRMRRVRIFAQEFSKFRCEYTEEARARRRTGFRRLAADPSLALPFLVPLKGPDALPAHAYEAAAWSRMYTDP
jgi:menaquinone-9 beta-reductase